ncbi:MAG TPA: type I 3-dehydroquinate dehydratase, partial [Thermoplasmata archaeon]|nr:type I 3-dehydroquinate dehydratase [Thermoplasmata archaeon]
FPSPMPLIATLRSRSEGGEGPDQPKQRARVLKSLAALPFGWIDLEARRDPQRFPTSVRTPGRITSVHLPAGSSAPTLRRWLSIRVDAPDWIKVVAPASVPAALRACRTALPTPAHRRRLIFQTVGASGPLVRALAWRLGLGAIYCAPGGGRSVETAQIPIDRLAHYLGGRRPGPLFALLGRDVSRSRSPSIFSRWMRTSGDRGLYVELELDSRKGLRSAFPALVAEGFRGFNVTQPWKVEAIRLADRVGTSATRCGCANVLTVTATGAVRADNTDLGAIGLEYASLRSSGRWDGKEVTVLGTGGAARAAIVAASELGAHVSVVARRASAGSALARELGIDRPKTTRPSPATLLVNATPIGRASAGRPEIPIHRFVDRSTFIVDFVYDADRPILRQLARSRGGGYRDGIGLLTHQARAAYRIWWGHEPRSTDSDRGIAGP